MNHVLARNITVDAVRPEDYERVGEIGVAAFAADLDLSEEYAAVLRRVEDRAAETVVLVARAGREVLGSVTLAGPGSEYAYLARGDEVEVRMLTVDPATRGRGVGEALMRAAAEWVREQGYPALVLSVVSDGGPRVPHRLYERVGFVRDRSRDYVGDWVPHPEMWCYLLEVR